MVSQFLVSIVDGLLLGCVYGLAAMGLNLIWGVLRVINLAHGALMALGMFGTYGIVQYSGLSPYLALVGVAVAGLALGILIYFISVHHVMHASHLSSLLATFAINMIIIGVGTSLFTTTPRNIDYSAGTLAIGDMTIPGTRLIAALASLGLSGALYYFLHHSIAGKQIRAVANNRKAAELMGIPTSRVLGLTFGIGTMLACVAGGLIATFFPFTILSGASYQSKSFVIGVLGGLGNPIGALLGGLLIGLLEGIIPIFMPVSWVPVLEFGLFVLILLVRPNGLLGAK